MLATPPINAGCSPADGGTNGHNHVERHGDGSDTEEEPEQEQASDAEEDAQDEHRDAGQRAAKDAGRNATVRTDGGGSTSGDRRGDSGRTMSSDRSGDDAGAIRGVGAFPGFGAGPFVPVEPLDPSIKQPATDKLPKVSGPCPSFSDGSTVNVSGINVKFWSGPAGKRGPLVFYWHGTGGTADEAASLFGFGTGGLGPAVIEEIKSLGGIVAAPDDSTGSGNSVDTVVWTTDDFQAADQIVACAIQADRIDPGRIHALGFSAGGLMAGTMYYLRSSYMASVVTYSGGTSPWPGNNIPQDARNRLPIMLFHGGPDDILVLQFQDQSNLLAADARANGSFALVCNHGLGHTIPPEGPTAAWAFFKAHPYNTNPEPWAAALPPSVPPYCVAK